MTARVDFYVLKSVATAQRLNFVCRLTEKAYLRGLRVTIEHDSAADAEVLDELLWSFSERAFIPHRLCLTPDSVDAFTPVHLAPSREAMPAADLLVNLSSHLPARLDGYERIAEIIDADEERKRLGRERFKAYRELKLVLQTHQLDESAEA